MSEKQSKGRTMNRIKNMSKKAKLGFGALAAVVVFGVIGATAGEHTEAPQAIEQAVTPTATPTQKSKPVQTPTAKPTDNAPVVDWAAYKEGMKIAIDAQARDKACDMLQFQFDKQSAQTQEAINRGIDPSKILEYIDYRQRQAGCIK